MVRGDRVAEVVSESPLRCCRQRLPNRRFFDVSGHVGGPDQRVRDRLLSECRKRKQEQGADGTSM